MSQASSTVNIYEVLSLGPDGKPLCPLRQSDDIVTHIRHIVAKSNSADVNALHGKLLNHGKLRRQRWNQLLQANDNNAGRPCCLATQQQDVPSSSTSDFDESAPVSPRDAPHDTITLPLSTAPSTDLTELSQLHSSRGLKVETAKVLADELASICDQSSNEYVAPDLLLQIAPAIVAALKELATTSLSMQLRDTLQPIHSPHDPTIDMETPSSLSDVVERDTASSEPAEISQQAQVNLSMANISGRLPAMNTRIDTELLNWWNKPCLLVDMLPPGENIAHRLYLAVSIPRHRDSTIEALFLAPATHMSAEMAGLENSDAETRNESASISPSAEDPPTPPVVDEISEDEWQAVKIIGEDLIHGKLHYTVEWKPTTVPEEDCGNMRESVEEWKRSQTRRRKGGKRTGSGAAQLAQEARVSQKGYKAS
uniref:Chromo domain-containing protein n=1 Tax=Bionectria ochroleuca TaxID=29856 RepID=A0A8H7K1D6_BIOOC